MTGLVAYAGVILSIIGMMLVIGGVVASGLFLPGVVVLVAAFIVFAVAALLPVLTRRASD